MGLFCVVGSQLHHLCERCGTVKVTYSNGRVEVYRPKLVDRCRRILDGVRPGESVEIDAGTLDRLGITESIYPPEDRPRA